MVSEKVTIVNPSGLHLLNAVNLSNSVSRYKSSMSFTYENNGMQGTVNLKSILSIVAAGIRQGDTIEICSSGEDEEEGKTRQHHQKGGLFQIRFRESCRQAVSRTHR